jgi:hypothetical protein
MKNLSALLSGVAVLFLISTAHAQPQDTALARIDNKITPKKTERSIGGPEKISEPSVEEVEAVPQVKFVVPETKNRNSKQSIIDGKVGPNGEELLMDKNGYYYFDEAGQKVRTSVEALKDKPKHS